MCLLAGCAAAPEAGRRFEVTGVVTAVPGDGTLVVAHDEVPGLMPAMTMPFVAESQAAIADVTPGDRVRFFLTIDDGASRISDVVVTEHTAAAARAGVAARRRSVRLRPGDDVPAFSLVDQHERPVSRATLENRRTILTFVFTRCPLPEFCPRIVSRFQGLQRTMAGDPRYADVQLLAVTIDPEFDRPDVLASYGKAVGADFDRWTFATGGRADVEVLTRAFAVYVEREGALSDHTLATAFVGRDGRVVDIWRGNAWDTDEVLAALDAHE